jgi:hypothetical protein
MGRAVKRAEPALPAEHKVLKKKSPGVAAGADLFVFKAMP